MTAEQVEKRLAELIYHEPFTPFGVEMSDGRIVDVPHPRVAFDGTGAVFISLDGGLVDFDFSNVRAIRQLNTEAVA